MLSVQDLSAWYGAARILYDLSFEVGRGEVVALMGRNGAGKSTTMKAIMGLIAKRSGAVRFNGDDISRCDPYQIARRGLGYTPEDRRIFVDLTVDGKSRYRPAEARAISTTAGRRRHGRRSGSTSCFPISPR